MGRTDDPYRLGWRFWSRHLLVGACAAVAACSLIHFLDEPITWSRFAASFILMELLFLGPALRTHYYGPKKR